MITTATALAQKAYHIQRNSLVSILLSEPFASGLTDAPAVLVQGRAVVSEDLEGKRLFQFRRIIGEKVGAVNYRKSPIMHRLMDWYYLRLVIDIVPQRMFIWEHGDWSKEPTLLGPNLPAYAPDKGTASASQPPLWKQRWAKLAATYPTAIVTVPSPDAYPFSFRAHVTAPKRGTHFAIDAVPAVLTASQLPQSLDGNLLFHRFGASMKQSTLRQFQVFGTITSQEYGARLSPTRYIPDPNSRVSDHAVGFEQLTAWPTFIRKGKRDARRYAQRRTFRQPAAASGVAE